MFLDVLSKRDIRQHISAPVTSNIDKGHDQNLHQINKPPLPIINTMMLSRFSIPEQPDMLLDQARPRWFISRGKGSFTPVIAVDELPKDVVLRGVPRSISVAEARGLEFLGEFTTPSQPYSLANSHMIAPRSGTDILRASPYEAPDADVNRAQSRRTMPDDRIHSSDTSKIDTSKFSHSASKGDQFAFIKAPFRETPVSDRIENKDFGWWRKSTPSGIEPDQSQKTYCTHWIKTGECDYMQQGCRYKHEVPDEETLRSIGILHVPKWWEEKNAIKIHPDVGGRKAPESPTWMQRRLMEDEEGSGRADAARKEDLPRVAEHRRSTPVPNSSSDTDCEGSMREIHPKKSASQAPVRNSISMPSRAKANVLIQKSPSRKVNYTDPDSGTSCMDISPPDTPVLDQARRVGPSTTQRRSDMPSCNGQQTAMSTQREVSPMKGLPSTLKKCNSVVSTKATSENHARSLPTAADVDELVASVAVRAQADKAEAQRSAKSDFKHYFGNVQENNGARKQGSDRADSDDGEYQPPPTPVLRRTTARGSAASSKPNADIDTCPQGSKLPVVKSAGGLMASKYANESPPQPKAQTVHRSNKRAGSVISVRSNSDGRQRREVGQSSRLGREHQRGLKDLRGGPMTSTSEFWASKIAA
ncbi:hypothetical protein K490DRAFT_61594 [Saccharata proteae CBS 121410]|uniref:C3H1-type domain-containing protein n=1 Tax=Saccharata proteae CBS 121410 TaxID=1314787 RepID=A0A9P4I4V2_9PEZI|nr:hypothetical protein K490DRAFT_61594 [Saccharata proteae CBS 121410]